MRTLKSRLPGLNALLVFEAAARHLSFTRAGEELCVSQAAVSRQIRQLEERLGSRLFHRRHRALDLTDAGRQLQQAVSIGFGHIADTAREIGSADNRARVNVATTVAFATYWFAPRLAEFRRHYPDVEVRVLASDRQRDHLNDSVDLALTCGWQPIAGWQATQLFAEEIFPVCSSAYLERHPVQGVEELPEHTLLHLDSRHWLDVGWDPVDWTTWLSTFGIAYQPRRPIVTFNNYPILVEAALDGQGIALGWRHLSAGLLSQDRLVRPVPESRQLDRHYYLVLREQTAPAPELLALREWLLQARSTLPIDTTSAGAPSARR